MRRPELPSQAGLIGSIADESADNRALGNVTKDLTKRVGIERIVGTLRPAPAPRVPQSMSIRL